MPILQNWRTLTNSLPHDPVWDHSECLFVQSAQENMTRIQGQLKRGLWCRCLMDRPRLFGELRRCLLPGGYCWGRWFRLGLRPSRKPRSLHLWAKLVKVHTIIFWSMIHIGKKRSKRIDREDFLHSISIRVKNPPGGVVTWSPGLPCTSAVILGFARHFSKDAIMASAYGCITPPPWLHPAVMLSPKQRILRDFIICIAIGMWWSTDFKL